jgi:hypothetical protein
MARLVDIGGGTVAVFLLLTTSLAGAEPSEAALAAARDMFHEARKAEDAGRWDEALTKLQAVAHVKVTPQVRFHLGLCLENVGRLVEALNHFERSRAEAVEGNLPTVMAEAKRHSADVRTRAAKLTLVLPAGREDVRVEVDDQPVDSVLLARPLLLDRGQHAVKASAPGLTFAKVISVAERQAVELEIELAPIRAPPPSAVHASGPTAPAASSVSPAGVGPAPSLGVERSSSASTAGWWFVGGGTALLAGALASSLVQAAELKHIESVCPSHVDCPRDLADSRARAQTSRTAAITLGALGGAGVVTGIALLFTSRRPSRTAGVTCEPWVTAHAAGATGAVSW